MDSQRRKEYAKLMEQSIKRIVETLSGKAERISIFGSSVDQNPDLFSDLDVLIIMDTEKPFLDRLKEIYSLLALPVDADILCYTPEEFNRIKHRGFFKTILQKEKVIYEKKSNI
jgi:predicted nucleotidyltransferase